ncbi:MAG: hypothetical protein LC792_16205 [Actinobacteria bacterium]|nr:hypothetical protein [Actinomycetota bacterium]
MLGQADQVVEGAAPCRAAVRNIDIIRPWVRRRRGGGRRVDRPPPMDTALFDQAFGDEAEALLAALEAESEHERAALAVTRAQNLMVDLAYVAVDPRIRLTVAA